MRLAAAMVLASLLGACATARVSQFDGFATAGIKYADTIPAVLDQAFETAVKTDSLVLLEARSRLKTQDERLNQIEESNANLATRLQIYTTLRAHAATLRAYFVALKALAASDAASGITQATKELTGSLGKLNADVNKLSAGKLPIGNFLDQAVPIAVAQFQSAALNSELRERAAAIERELSLQQAALSAIASSVKSELEAQFAARERDQIQLPYVRQGALPGDWSERRLAAFRRRIELTAMDAAVSAARNLKLSYVALAENRLDEGSVALLLGDLEKLVTLLESIKGKPAPA